jgi:signal transduction histidine kinase
MRQRFPPCGPFRCGPPWWLAGEAWTPPGDAGLHWRRMRGRFVRRMAALAAMFGLLMVLALSLALSFAGVALGIVPGPRGIWIVPALATVVGLFAAGAVLVQIALRRAASPAAELLEAIGRLAEGDYDVRVAERGVPELRRVARAFNAMAAGLGAHDRERRHLLADVAHELRTPLAVLQGNVEGMLDGIYPRDDRRLGTLLEETQILSKLIEDVRTLALAETRTLELHRELVDPACLVDDAVAAFRAAADEHGVAIVADCDVASATVFADPLRIRQVLSNLLANAIEHTLAGGEVRLRCSINRSQPDTIAISVSDTGSGIAAEDLPRIFDRFYKSRTSRGSGLGLAIAQQLVGLHGGTIGAESTLGEGTTVRFTLPMRPAG